MLSGFALLERREVEVLGFSAFLSVDKGLPDRVEYKRVLATRFVRAFRGVAHFRTMADRVAVSTQLEAYRHLTHPAWLSLSKLFLSVLRINSGKGALHKYKRRTVLLGCAVPCCAPALSDRRQQRNARAKRAHAARARLAKFLGANAPLARRRHRLNFLNFG